ncbi:lipocalin family protein [Methylicorpusculum sp.]|uniref:lipocalin family protein n=1 Tax=Methylicorpusculum sp. TaxID=2713644 RepID=UPI00351E2B26
MAIKTCFFLLSLLISGCVGVPEGISVVDDFNVQRYLGKWYEIARLDHRFERGLTHISAEYSLREDGGLKVINSGYNTEKGRRDKAEGRAYFTGSPQQGSLKVSFFGPFYGGYNIIDLDKENYSYAMIAGPDRDYLWILARQPELDKTIVDRLVAKAKSLGFTTDQLIYVEHQPVHNQTDTDSP